VHTAAMEAASPAHTATSSGVTFFKFIQLQYESVKRFASFDVSWMSRLRKPIDGQFTRASDMLRLG
jgi:hypothetical protein